MAPAYHRRMVTVSFPDRSWLDDVGPVDGMTPVVWDPRTGPPGEAVDLYIAPYMTRPTGVSGSCRSCGWSFRTVWSPEMVCAHGSAPR